MSKLNLIVDTSIHGAVVGLMTADGSSKKLIYSDVSGEVMDSARQLPLMVQRGLMKVGAQMNDIDGLIVSQGPGSFTGIRVGLAYVYGLFCGFRSQSRNDVSILGVSSLELLAKSISLRTNSDVTLFLPSTKSTGYAAISDETGERLIAIDSSKRNQDGGWPKSWFVIGQWAAIDLLAFEMKSKVHEFINEKHAGQMALDAISDKLRSQEALPWSAEMPHAIYLRKSTVEEKAEERH